MFVDWVATTMEVPEGYAAIPISAEQMAVPLRLCALVSRKPDPIAGELVVLRDAIDARVVLGCVIDAAGKVQRWLDLWVQDPARLGGIAGAGREALSNAVLDQRWQQQAAALAELPGAPALATGWEAEHPPPTFLDPAAGEPFHPVDAESGDPWLLCRDDALLKSKNLPPYSTSLHRYLHLPQRGIESHFVPVTPQAPETEDTEPVEAILRGRSGLVALNPGGGLIFARGHAPASYESFVDLLGGGGWGGVLHGRSPVPISGPADSLREDGSSLSAEGRLFMGTHGQWGRLVETLHLKLRAFADAAEAVHGVTRRCQRPLLNLTADSFNVGVGAPGAALPFLWTGRTVLADAGDAISLTVETTDSLHFLRGRGAAVSVYYPESASKATSGRGSLRIRKVLPQTGGRSIVEGTFSTQEKIEAATYDLAWFRLNVTCGRVDLYGRIERDRALAAGEWRFRTIGQWLGERADSALREAEGVPMADTAFEVLPLLSSPFDLYSLAVLAARTFLVDQEASLPVAWDEVLSLARQVAEDYDESTELIQRIQAVFDADRRWVDSLGPHRLTCKEVEPDEAFDLVPAEVWFGVLGMIIRMIPGVGPDSICRDYGHAQPGGIHKVYDPVIGDLEMLLTRTRSLIVIDWRFNREVHSVIRRYVMGTS